jgi:hypothetical protein
MRALLTIIILSFNVSFVIARDANHANDGSAPKHKKRNDNVVKSGYTTIGAGYVAGPGQFNPYKQGASLNVSNGYLVDGAIIVDVSIAGNFLFKPSNHWYYQAGSGTPDGGLGYYDMLNVGIMPVILNNKHDCLAAGFFWGGEYIAIPPGHNTGYVQYAQAYSSVFSYAYGFKVHYYPDENFLIFAQINFAVEKEINVDSYGGQFSRPANFYTVNVGAALKFDW